MEHEKVNLILGEIQMYLDISEEEAAHVVEMVKDDLIWHGPDVVPPYMKAMYESVEVINQSGEKVLYDLLDDQWFSADNPGREAHVEKWSYLEPIKR